MASTEALERRVQTLEGALRADQQLTGVGSWEMDLSGGLWWSDELRRLMAVAEGVPPDVERFFDRVHSADRAALRGLYDELREHAAAHAVACRIVQQDGPPRHVIVEAGPIYDGDGTVTGFRGTVRDVTEMRALQAHLREAQKMQALGQFAAGVAHDFNNALAIILGHAQRLRRDAPQPSVEEIIRAADHGAALVRRLLDFGGDLGRAAERVPIDEVVRDTLRLAESTIAPSVRVEPSLDAPDARVLADRSQFAQLLLNLLRNACDAMPHGGSLRIRTEALQTTDPRAAGLTSATSPWCAVLTVQDTGVGMTDEVASRVFEPFFTTKSPGDGTGLGLPQVMRLLTQWSGRVSIDSEPGVGTTVRVGMPAVR